MPLRRVLTGSRWRYRMQAILSCWLVPLLGALLPWAWTFPLLQWLSRWPGLYRDETGAALSEAQRFGAAPDPAAWRARHRLVRLVDNADLGASATGGTRWMRRYLTVAGDAVPPQGPLLAFTFHWGAGLWAMRHLGQRGPVAFLHRPVAAGAGGLPQRTMLRCRLRHIERIGGAHAIPTGGAGPRIRAALAAGQTVVALPDAPAPDRAADWWTLPVAVPGSALRHLRLRRGLIRLAVAARVPVFAFTAAIDPATGGRRLVIRGPLSTRSEAELAGALATVWRDAMAADPAAWHLWGGAASLLTAPEPEEDVPRVRYAYSTGKTKYP